MGKLSQFVCKGNNKNIGAMIRIGIITLPLHFNFGGILQAFALQKIVGEIGAEAYTIVPPINGLKQRLKFFLYSFSGVYKFVNEHIRIISFDLSNTNDYKKHHFDSFIVGSDQVWRPCMGRDRKENIERYFIKTPINICIKKNAYAVSFGVENWEFTKEETLIARELISDFQNVTVREKSGIYLCNNYLGIDNVVHVLDPTMLLDVKCYMEFLQSSPFHSDKQHAFVYLLDYKNGENSDIVFSILSKDAEIRYAKVECHVLKKYLFMNNTVEQWLTSIYYSDIFITDSFHGCVFAILFHKDFYVMANALGGNSRMSSLLQAFGLENRFIDSADLADLNSIQAINWNDVDDKLLRFRNISVTILRKMVEK